MRRVGGFLAAMAIAGCGRIGYDPLDARTDADVDADGGLDARDDADAGDGRRDADGGIDAGSDADAGDADAIVDGDAAGPPSAWGAYVDGLGLSDCPSDNVVLVVDDASSDLDGGATITSVAEAGPTLSLREAMAIAVNDTTNDTTIQFDPAVFPPGVQVTIAIGAPFELADNLCIDGRGHDVVIDLDASPLDTGTVISLLGLTFVNVTSSVLFPYRVEGCRFNTDGTRVIGDGYFSMYNGFVGAGTVFMGTVGVELVGNGFIRDSYFGYDPSTGLVAPLEVALTSNTTVITNNPSLIGCYIAAETTLAGMANRANVEQSHFCDLGGVPGSTIGFRTIIDAPGGIRFGPGNHAAGCTAAIDNDGTSPLQITQSSIHDNTQAMIGSIAAGPTIEAASASGANGRCATLGGTIELFADDADQGETYLGSTSCNGSDGLPGGAWSYAGALPAARNVTATHTLNGSTTNFSAPFAIP